MITLATLTLEAPRGRRLNSDGRHVWTQHCTVDIDRHYQTAQHYRSNDCSLEAQPVHAASDRQARQVRMAPVRSTSADSGNLLV